MKRYFIPILMAILVLASGALVSCGQNESTAKLIAYLDEEQPISERHVETVTAIDEAMERIILEAKKPHPDDPSKTQLEAIELPKPSAPNAIQSLTAEALIRSLTAPKTPPEPIIPSGLREALTSGVDTLDWALGRMDSEILDYNKLNPPPESVTYHGLMAEVLLKERAIFDDFHSYYSSLLSNGYGDVEPLDRAEKASVERDSLQLLIQHEWEEIVRKVGK